MELSVSELVADGLTNPEIGTRLFVSRRTVETHISHVFRKIGCVSRRPPSDPSRLGALTSLLGGLIGDSEEDRCVSKTDPVEPGGLDQNGVDGGKPAAGPGIGEDAGHVLGVPAG